MKVCSRTIGRNIYKECILCSIHYSFDGGCVYMSLCSARAAIKYDQKGRVDYKVSSAHIVHTKKTTFNFNTTINLM